MKFTNSIKLLILLIFIWIILASLFGIYDLQISIILIDEQSSWGNFGANYGEVPGYILIAISLTTYLGSYIKDTKRQKTPIILAIITGAVKLILGVFNNNNTDISLGSGLIIVPLLYLGFTWNKDWGDYRKLSAVISFLAIINPFLLVQLMKLFWGRIRFRNLAINYSNFTPWFIPLGITGNFSFPSGHAAMGWMFLPFMIHFRDRKINVWLRMLLALSIFGWGMFVALSRIIIGAHYASDVLFSTGFASIITIFLYRKIYSNREP
ncbi:MAG: phosphatase PAP2 family protein [Promethearchaeota archaeon]